MIYYCNHYTQESIFVFLYICKLSDLCHQTTKHLLTVQYIIFLIFFEHSCIYYKIDINANYRLI